MPAAPVGWPGIGCCENPTLVDGADAERGVVQQPTSVAGCPPSTERGADVYSKPVMGAMPIEIVLNGQRRTLDRDPTIAMLLRELGLDPRTVAVERNLEIVPRASYDTTVLCEGDTLEVVTFVGGG